MQGFFFNNFVGFVKTWIISGYSIILQRNLYICYITVVYPFQGYNVKKGYDSSLVNTGNPEFLHSGISDF